MMRNQDLVGKIKRLSKIQPSQEWFNLTRQNLLKEIGIKSPEASWERHFFNWIKQPQSFALAICLLLIFGGGPWLMVQASQPSLPGQWLYSVKMMSEQVQSTVAAQDSRLQLKTEFASRRVEELNRIANDSSAPQKKSEKTKQVLDGFRDNLASISQEVAKAPDKINKDKVLAAAEKTKKIKAELDRTKEMAPEEMKSDLAEAEKTVENVHQQILAVLIGEDPEEKAKEPTATTTDKEIIIFSDQLNQTSSTIENIIKSYPH